jgi:hypothetical protein
MLSCRRVATAVVILPLACTTCRRCSGGQGFPGDFSSFLARLLQVAVVSPEVCSVFAAVYKDAAGPCCPDACQVELEMSPGALAAGEGKDANLEGRSSLETAAGLFAV